MHGWTPDGLLEGPCGREGRQQDFVERRVGFDSWDSNQKSELRRKCADQLASLSFSSVLFRSWSIPDQ